ncbi:FAD-dependent oxidoreductase [Roseomonas stagni]|uniref:FAD-dependent oxidoreductase n=1 Tax=Falsiroseomonas algicola TaxID=2716930 RepID=A0A6M1LKD0_9PROT|nr:FAD-binding protein [Falsiroseomonas algicola]NGM20751.1 FAD-dependent oxidoreductase [Falsiroseomonas algicola]
MAAGEEFDLVVAGCGVAGLSAAVAAAEQGARVVVLERAPQAERGGQSRYTEAYLRMKSESEVTDDFETHLAENGALPYADPDLAPEVARPMADRAGHARALSMIDPDVVQEFANQAGPTIAWLKTMGVRFDFLPTQFLTKSQPRLLPVGGGAALVEALAKRAEEIGVAFRYETTAQRLIQDEEGRVTGLVARQAGRMLRFLGPVTLACGGFEGDAEMSTRYLGPRSSFLRTICKGGLFNRGEGIRMALDIGAAPSGDFGSYHAEPIDPRSSIAEPSVFLFPYGILVNKEGRRFVDEAPGTVDATYERVTRRIYEQRDGIAWVILDARHREIPNWRLGLRTDQPPIEGESIEALAQAIGLPEAALVATVADYNAACVPGEWKPLQLDGLATRGLVPQKSNWATPLVTGPFHAYPIISANVFTFGGVRVDEKARVLDTGGDPIPGLYAAGEVVGMYYGTYTGATSVLKGLVFGRLAGSDVATTRRNL